MFSTNFSEWLNTIKSALLPLKSNDVANVVGIDFGATNIKILKIKKSDNGYQVENLSIYPLPEGLISKDEIKDPIALGNILREAFRTSGITSRNVAVAIPRASAMIKNITIDSRLDESEIESRAWIEANRLFPDLVGDIYLDFNIIGRSSQDPNALEMILVACRKDQIKPYLETLKNANLVPKIVDVNCYALERALPLAETKAAERTIALLNLNLKLSTFVVIQNKQLIHAHDQSYDGQRLMIQVQQYLKDKTQDESLLSDEKFNNILKENLISHLRHTVHFFYSSKPNLAIQELILSGDCAGIPGLSEFIEKELGMSTKVASPFLGMSVAPEVDQQLLKENAPALMMCCGLALSKVGA